MKEELTLRKLIKDDYLDVLELEKQVHEIHYSHRPDLYNNVDDLFPREYFNSIIDNPNSITFGIENNNKIVAIIISELKEIGNISIVKRRRYCFVDDIVVDSNYRRRGHAKALFNELKNEISKLGINDIELTVWPFNKEAILFYESLGMTVKNIKYELKSSDEITKEKVEINTTQSAN